MDLLEIDMQLGTLHELIARLRVDILPDATGDDLLTAQGELSTLQSYLKSYEGLRDQYMHHEEAIHVMRRAILLFQMNETGFRRFADIEVATGKKMMVYRVDSKFEVERMMRACRTLDCPRTSQQPIGNDEYEILLAISPDTMKEIQSLKKPRIKRRRNTRK